MTRSFPPLLFDLDGTLVDSSVVVARHWGEFAGRHGLDLEAILLVCHGRRTADTIADVAPWLPAAGEAAILDAAEEVDVDGVRAVAGARDLLLGLASPWAVVTSAHRALAASRLRAAGLPLPDVLVCGDEVARGKPDPEGLLSAARALGVDPPGCVVVEDAPAGIEAGRAAGARVIAVATTHRRLALGNADVVVDDLRGFPRALEALSPPVH